MFPVERLDEIRQKPDNFHLLQRVPLSVSDVVFPFRLAAPAGDEQVMIILDTETTGLEYGKDKIIELGLVKILYSQSAKIMTSIEAELSIYEDPGFPISEEITALTGITDDMVSGKTFDVDLVASWFEGDPVVVAHNASFDRPFFEKRFPAITNLRWGCTFQGIDWRGMGYSNSKLDYILFRQGYFFEGHRASIDCHATAWMLNGMPGAFGQLVDSINTDTWIIEARNSPFDSKDLLKARKYRWNADQKVWWTQVNDDQLQVEKDFLDTVPKYRSASANYIKQTSFERFK